MSKVYGDAFVTIAASSVRACDEGMIFSHQFVSSGSLVYEFNTERRISERPRAI
jgi:hypothetical protein